MTVESSGQKGQVFRSGVERLELDCANRHVSYEHIGWDLLRTILVSKGPIAPLPTIKESPREDDSPYAPACPTF